MRKRTTKSKPTDKRETLEEYFQRGGTITKIDPVPLLEDSLNQVASTPGVSQTLMSLAEGALYYSESKAKPKERKKSIEKINKDALPASLLKYMPKRGEE
jgi:hypothetical protein